MMERALKERIIGAVVLVIFVVLVVPIFLDGPPKESEIVSERLLLPGQDGQDTKTVVLDRERAEPIPVPESTENEDDTSAAVVAESVVAEPARENPAPEPVAQQTTAQAEQETTPKLQAETVQPRVTTTGMWAVQLGSFSNKQNAEKLAADL